MRLAAARRNPMHRQMGAITQISSSMQIPRSGVVVIDFFATWCGPCKTVAPYFEQLAETYKGFAFVKADVDRFDDADDEYEVRVMPSFFVLKDGKVVAKVEGADLNRLMKVLGEIE